MSKKITIKGHTRTFRPGKLPKRDDRGRWTSKVKKPKKSKTQGQVKLFG